MGEATLIMLLACATSVLLAWMRRRRDRRTDAREARRLMGCE